MSKIVGNVDMVLADYFKAYIYEKYMRNIVTTLLDVDGGDVAALLRLLPVAVNSLLIPAANSATPEADTAAQVVKVSHQ